MKNISYFICGAWICANLGAVPSSAEQPSSDSMAPAYLTDLRSGDEARLREALQHGASANARDAAGNTPLMWSAVYGNTRCLEALLQNGAEVNATNAAGGTALMRAAFDFQKTRLLI